MSVEERITRAAESLDTPEEAAELLAEAWREQPTSELGALLRRVVERAPGCEVTGRTRADKCKRWDEVEAQGRSADLPGLTAILGSLGRDAATSRLRRLTGRPPDPRVADGMIAVLQQPPHGYQGIRSYQFWNEVFAQLQRCGDAHTIAHLEELARGYANSISKTTIGWQLRDRFGPAIAAIRERCAVATLPAGAQDAFERLRDALEPGTQTPAVPLEELYAEVYRQPGEDGPRAVLADALLEAGDPRGEFIQLQLVGASKQTRTAAERKREAELKKRYGRVWLGPLEPIVQKAWLSYERGFPVQAKLHSPQTRFVDAAIGLPEWSTFHTLDATSWDSWDSRRLDELLGHPHMRSLRRVLGAPAQMLYWSREFAWEELSLARHALPKQPLADELAFAAAMPRLEVLDVVATSKSMDVELFDPLWQEGALGRRLRRFRVLGYPSMFTWAKHAGCADLPVPELELPASAHDPWGAMLTRVGPCRYDAHFRCEWPDAMRGAVARLAAELSTLPRHMLRNVEVSLHHTNEPASAEELVALNHAFTTRFSELGSLLFPKPG